MTFCPNFSNKRVKEEFDELVNIFEELYPGEGENVAYLLWDKTKGEGLGLPQANGLSNRENDIRKQLIVQKSIKIINGDNTFVFYQGRKQKNRDNRRYNYWTANAEEAKSYGPNVISRRIHTDNFLRKYKPVEQEDGTIKFEYSDEYAQINEEFKEKYGYKYGFDILDNSEEGLQKQNQFFELVESKGYRGYREYEESVEDNQYVVTFGGVGSRIKTISFQELNENVASQVAEFCGRLGFDLKHSDANTVVDFANKLINIHNFTPEEFNKIKAEVASVLMPSDLKNKLLAILGKNPKNFKDSSEGTKIISDAILEALQNKNAELRKHEDIFHKILDFIKNIIDSFLQNQSYFEHIIQNIAEDVNDSNSEWYRTVIQDGFQQKQLDIDKLQKSPLYNVYQTLTSLGASLDGSAAVRAQGTLYRSGEEDFHDLDFTKPYDSFSYDVYVELNEFFNNYKTATNDFQNLDKYIYKDLREHMLENVEQHLRNSDIYKELSKHYSNITIKHAAKTKELGLFVTILVDGNPVDIFYAKNVKSYNISGIKVTDFSVPFAAKLIMRRDKDIRDIINFHKNKEQQNNSSSEEYITEESVHKYVQRLQKEKETFINDQLKRHLSESLSSIEEFAVQTEKEWGEHKQKEILGETQLKLAEAFGLTKQEDGSWVTVDKNDPIAKLRVEFVNRMNEPGSIDFNHHSTNAHSLILIGMNEGDASTFNHELAHYYIRTFWNSKAVQDALSMVYKKSMGDYKTDPNARIAVEEALVDYITAQTVDNAYLTELESDNGFKRFWQAFNKMLYKVFNIKTDTAKNAILNQIVQSFVVNEQLSNNARDIKFVMHDGIMHQTEYQKRKVRPQTQTKYSQTSRNMMEETVNNIVRAVQNKEKSYKTQSIDQTNATYGNAEQMAFNQESVRLVKEAVRKIEASRAAKDDTAELMEKVGLFNTFLQRADEEIQKVLSIMYNARANERYSKLMYEVDSFGVEHYQNAANESFTAANATSETKERAYTFDDLQYAKNDIIGFFSPIIRSIVRICNDADTYGVNQADAQHIIEFVNSTQLVSRINAIESMYAEARKQKCLEWINESVDSRDELNDDFKNRMKINMHKWLDEQMDFGDVSIFETYIGMGTMSKSPIIKALQDELSNMQFEKDQIVYKKAMSLNEQLQKAKKELGWKYSILPFNVQKLLLQLDRYGLPTGNLISAFNTGQYKRDLESFKNEKLFGKNGLESKLRQLKDASGNPICQGENGKPWKLMLDQFGNPIIPDNPQCNTLEKDYLTDLEMFKSDKQIRRYTPQYYIDRIGILSVKTLKALNEIEQQIDDIKNAVTINDKFRPDLLTDSQQQKLKDLHDQRNQLSSPYELDGSLKVPGTDEYEIAQELKNWHVICSDKIVYKPDIDAYNESLKNAKDKNKFIRRFAKYQINPEIWDYVMMHALNYDPNDPDYIKLKRLKYDRSKLLIPYKGFEIGQIDFNSLYDSASADIKKANVFKELKRLDSEISKLNAILRDRYEGTGQKYDTEAGERFVLQEQMIPYNYIPGVTRWNSISQYNQMLNDIQVRINADPSIPIDKKQQELAKYENLLTYYDDVNEMYVPLSIFSTTIARQGSKTVMVKDQAPVESYVVLPGDMFSTIDVAASTGKGYVNPEYDHAQATQDGPIYLTNKYKDARYAKYINAKHPELVKLLEDVKELMKTSYEGIPFLGQYDGRAAQIGARTGQILGRKWYNIPRLLKNIGEFFRREFEIVETDTDFLQQDDGYNRRPDGSIVQNIPIRFVKRLDNPEYISSDVVGSALKFFEMSTNYKIKTERAPKMNTILSELSKTENYVRANTGSMFTTSQAEVVRGMYDRHLYETKNVDTNSRDYILDEEWKRFDWFRKYIVSNPSAWIKRVQKSRAAFQLGMLALNATSGIISFLDPLISMSIDVATGKYINYKDFLYALFKMSPLQGNVYGNMISLGGIRAHSKAAAAMQKFQLAKSNFDAVSDMDQGKLMRFLSDGLTMKHFTLGDYTINTINVIATMHNYRYYKKIDGTAEFYPKEIFIQKVMDDLGCDVRKAKDMYDDAVTMWSACKVSDNGEFVAADTEYGDAISQQNWKDVKNRVRSRSSIYNGVVPDLERSLMQTNVIWSFVTMLRNFFITGVWERFQGYNDFQVASLDESGNPVDRPATYQEIKEAKKRQRFYKGGLNMATRMVENGVDRGAFSWLTHIGPYLKYAFHIITHPEDRSKYSESHKQYLKQKNLSQTDIYGMQKIFMEFTVFLLLLAGSAVSMRVAADDDNKDSYVVQMWNLLQMRLTIERFTFFSPQTAMDLISSPTAALSDWKRKAKLFDLMYDAVGLSEHDLHEEVKRGRYAGEERWKYNLFNGLSSFGINNWYADMPEDLGGGGAKSVKEKGNFYKGLIKGVFMGQLAVPSKKDSETESSSKKSSSRSRSGSRSRR